MQRTTEQTRSMDQWVPQPTEQEAKQYNKVKVEESTTETETPENIRWTDIARLMVQMENASYNSCNRK